MDNPEEHLTTHPEACGDWCQLKVNLFKLGFTFRVCKNWGEEVLAPDFWSSFHPKTQSGPTFTKKNLPSKTNSIGSVDQKHIN